MATRQERPDQAENQERGGTGTDDQQATPAGEAVGQELQQRIDEVIQPMIADLQQHISETVQQQMQQGGAQQAEGNGEGETGPGGVGERIQQAYEAVADILRRIWARIQEIAQTLEDKAAEAIGELVSIMVQRAIKSAL